MPTRTSFQLRLLAAAALGTLAGLLAAQWNPPAPAFAQAPPAQAQTATTAPAPIAFDDYFVDKALRLELYDIGDAKDEIVTLSNIYEEPLWPENPKNLIPPFEGGHYAVKVFDAASNTLIFEKEFDTMFGEYKTTTPAINGVKRVFEKSVRIPEPKKTVKVSFEARDKKLVLAPKFTTTIAPGDNHIIRENPKNPGDTVFELLKSGDPHDKVDLVFVSEGYTAADKDKFKADAQRFADSMFTFEPYKSNKNRFNINAVYRASAEKGMDESDQRPPRYRNTVLNSHYNSFDLDRYLLTDDAFTLHRMAAQVPYDTVIVLVNSTRYGGGSICLDYCIASADGPGAAGICVHEFGHSFAALADEYTGNVAYNDAYPAGVEPLEPNITEMLDPKNIKWKQFLTPGVQIPTPAVAGSKDVGAFEGAGYLKKGMYRPQMNCIMGTAGRDNTFCVVCRAGIQRMIDYYAPPEK